MVRGHHIATCFCCGTRWMVGDCIPSVCKDCYDKGHRGGWECPKCKEEFENTRKVDRKRRASDTRTEG